MRVGAAYGAVLRRLGDVFGEPVNIASRLTSIARPGRVLVDRELAEALRPHEEEFRLRRVRGISVKGYSRLETWALKRPRGPRTARRWPARRSRHSRTCCRSRSAGAPPPAETTSGPAPACPQG